MCMFSVCSSVCVSLSTRNFLIIFNSLITIKTFLKLTDNNRSISYFVSFQFFIYYYKIQKNSRVILIWFYVLTLVILWQCWFILEMWGVFINFIGFVMVVGKISFPQFVLLNLGGVNSSLTFGETLSIKL